MAFKNEFFRKLFRFLYHQIENENGVVCHRYIFFDTSDILLWFIEVENVMLYLFYTPVAFFWYMVSYKLLVCMSGTGISVFFYDVGRDFIYPFWPLQLKSGYFENWWFKVVNILYLGTLCSYIDGWKVWMGFIHRSITDGIP